MSGEGDEEVTNILDIEAVPSLFNLTQFGILCEQGYVTSVLVFCLLPIIHTLH